MNESAEFSDEQTESLLAADLAIEMGEVSGEMEKNDDPPRNTSNSVFTLLNAMNSFHTPALGSWITARRESIRSWTQFLNTSSFSTPTSLRSVSGRIIKNLVYFQSNYFIIFLLLIAYCLITSPLLLLVIVASIYGGNRLLKRHEQHKFTFMGRELTKKEIYLGLALCTMPLFWLVGVGSVVFWALGASFFFIGLHAIFYNIESRELNDENFGLMENV